MSTQLEDKAQTIVQELEQVQQAKLQRDVEVAEKVQARMLKDRKTAPDGLTVGATWGRDDRLELIKRHVPEALPKADAQGRVHNPEKGVDGWNQGATMFVMFDTAEKHKKHVDEGYIPVVDEGQHVKCGGGDLMYKRDIRFKRDEMKASTAMSDNWLKSPDADMKAAAAAGGGDTLPGELRITKGAPKG